MDSRQQGTLQSSFAPAAAVGYGMQPRILEQLALAQQFQQRQHQTHSIDRDALRASHLGCRDAQSAYKKRNCQQGRKLGPHSGTQVQEEILIKLVLRWRWGWGAENTGKR